MTDWHVVLVEQGRDASVARDLGSQDFRTFIAWTFERKAIGSEVVIQTKLRLTGYLFVSVDRPRQSWRDVTETLHVADFLGHLRDGEKHPQAVPEPVIAGLMRDQVEDFEAASRRVRRKASPFAPRQIVRIPDLGFEGPIEETRPDSVMVRINGFPWRVDNARVSTKLFQRPAVAAT